MKRVAQQVPHLEYLALCMQVTTSPPKWKLIRQHPASRAERAQRVRACVIDYSDERLLRKVFCDNSDVLRQSIRHHGEQLACRLRVIAVEDLSRDLIELLGAEYDIDPRFFREFIGDYLYYNSGDKRVQVPTLLVEQQARPFSTFGFLRARYFRDEEDFDEADRQSGMFNVLRRLDSDRSRKVLRNGRHNKNASVSLGRSKAALWTKPASTHQPAIAVCLVDPTVTAGLPLWGGIENAANITSMNTGTDECIDQNQSASLFEQVIAINSRIGPEDLARIEHNSHFVGIFLCKIALKEWLITTEYMITQIGRVSWEFKRPHWAEKAADINDLLLKLTPWQQTIHYYEEMVRKARGSFLPCNTDLLPKGARQEYESLRPDFDRVLQRLCRIRKKMAEVEASLAPFMGREDSIRNEEAISHTRMSTSLSVLAMVFLPLNFVASYFSMSSNFTTSSNTFWLFFAVGVPLTLVVIGLVRYTQRGKYQRNQV